jgi:putative membrane protein
MPGQVWTPYCGVAPLPTELLGRWNFDPVLIGALILATLVMARRKGSHRWAGLAGLAVLAVIFVSPLCALSSALFSARTVHHVLLVALAAPLLAWSQPPWRNGRLGAAVLVQAVIFWAWHAPAAYAAALSDDGVYWLMQASLLVSAVWFWRAVRSAASPAAAAGLLAAMVAMGLLGAILTFAETPLYAPHLATTLAWGVTALEDQQAAGLIMWAPAAAIYLLAALLTMHRLFKTSANQAFPA